MSVPLVAGLIYGSSVGTVVALAPYRDLAYSFSWRYPPGLLMLPGFCVKRYKGMLRTPSKPLLLGMPPTALYAGYVGGGGDLNGALVGGFCFGYTKIFVRTFLSRMGRMAFSFTPEQPPVPNNARNCFVNSVKQFGFCSFFPGAVAASLIAVIWHGLALAVVQQNEGRDFHDNFLNAFRIHALLAIVTTPLRNSVRSSMPYGEYPGGAAGLIGYVRAEAWILWSSVTVLLRNTFTLQLRFFLDGAIRTPFVTSVPFALIYAAFKFFGGNLGSGKGTYGATVDSYMKRLC